MHESNSLGWKISDSRFFNEGMTEYLTGCIMGTGNNSLYFNEYEMAEFYCNITKYNNPLLHFLKDEYAFDDNTYIPKNLAIYSEKFDNNNKKLDAYLGIQREILNGGLKNFKINSFDDFVEIVTIINKRPKYDPEYIDIIFERVTKTFLSKFDFNEEQYQLSQKQLIDFCKVSNKYQLYGENSVAEYILYDLYIALIENGYIKIM